MSEQEKKDAVATEAQVPAQTTPVAVETPAVDTQKEDDKRMGIKEVIANSDAMAIEKDKVEGKKEEVKKPIMPSFFMDKVSKHRVEVDILSSKEDGKIMSVSRVGLGLDFEKEFDYLNHSLAWFDFTIPTYEDMSSYRTRCAIYRKDAGQMVVDRLQLRNFILVWHLKDWSLTDADGNKVELNHDPDGSLDDASMKRAYSLHPTLIDVVLTIFEKDILLT